MSISIRVQLPEDLTQEELEDLRQRIEVAVNAHLLERAHKAISQVNAYFATKVAGFDCDEIQTFESLPPHKMFTTSTEERRILEDVLASPGDTPPTE